jgi:hypothetical protein
MSNRRRFLQHALGLGAGLLASQRLFGESQMPPASPRSSDLSKRDRRKYLGPAFNAPVITPDVGDLPYSMDGSTKVFRLTAQVVTQQIAPNKTLDLWGFNGSAPAPRSRSRRAITYG